MPIRAAILTISDKGAAGEREDTSGAAIRELLESIGATIDRYEIIPDERATISARLTGMGRRRQARPHRHHRRHRPWPARRHAPGHARCARLRSARPRRSDARRRPQAHADVHAQPRRRRRPRPHPDRQPPRQPQRRPREPIGHPAGASPRRRAPARRALRAQALSPNVPGSWLLAPTSMWGKMG